MTSYVLSVWRLGSRFLSSVKKVVSVMELPEILHVQSESSSQMQEMGIGYRTKHKHCVQKACSVLKSEGIIAVPTDTIYGIAGIAQSQKVVANIYNIKNRNTLKPIAICVGQIKDIYRWGNVTISNSLLEELLPGPVTLVFERTLELNPSLNPGTTLVGIRIPDNLFIRDLCTTCGQPLALTSANKSAAKSPLCVDEFRDIWNHLDLICDGGTLGHTEQSRLGSTVVDLSKPGLFTVIREGSAYIETCAKLTKYNLKEDVKE